MVDGEPLYLTLHIYRIATAHLTPIQSRLSQETSVRFYKGFIVRGSHELYAPAVAPLRYDMHIYLDACVIMLGVAGSVGNVASVSAVHPHFFTRRAYHFDRRK